MQEHMQRDMSACDMKVKIDVELQGKENVLEIKMHADLRVKHFSEKWKEKHSEMCNLRPNQL